MTPATQTQINTATATVIRPELLRLLDDLPQPKQIELLNFARYLRQQAVIPDEQRENGVALRGISAGTLARLTGIVALGGDAVLDSEALYDGS